MSYVKLSAEAKQGSFLVLRSRLQGDRHKKAFSCFTEPKRVSIACVTLNSSWLPVPLTSLHFDKTISSAVCLGHSTLTPDLFNWVICHELLDSDQRCVLRGADLADP